MEDFHAGGSLPSLWRRLKDHLDLNAKTVNGETIGEIIARWPAYVDDKIIRQLDNPLVKSEAIAILTGNLAPGGAAIKLASATPELFQHEGPALVFDSLEDLEKRIDDPNLNVTPQTVMVLTQRRADRRAGNARSGRSADPEEARLEGAEGHGEAVGRADERHGVRHRGAACVAGGRRRRTARSGSRRRPDRVGHQGRKLNLKVDDAELNKRRAGWRPPQKPARGYIRLYTDRVTQAEHGCDFDFLAGEKT